MALPDLTVRQAKAAEKSYSFPDTDGLGLVAAPTGGKAWHLRYLARQAEAAPDYSDAGLSGFPACRGTTPSGATTG